MLSKEIYPTRFILTMRNLNKIPIIIGANSFSSFILTMRNLNIQESELKVRTGRVLY